MKTALLVMALGLLIGCCPPPAFPAPPEGIAFLEYRPPGRGKNVLIDVRTVKAFHAHNPQVLHVSSRDRFGFVEIVCTEEQFRQDLARAGYGIRQRAAGKDGSER